MFETLSERWSRWLELSGTSSLSSFYVEREVLRSLASEGFDVPRQRALKETLEHGLKPIVRLAGPLHGASS